MEKTNKLSKTLKIIRIISLVLATFVVFAYGSILIESKLKDLHAFAWVLYGVYGILIFIYLEEAREFFDQIGFIFIFLVFLFLLSLLMHWDLVFFLSSLFLFAISILNITLTLEE